MYIVSIDKIKNVRPIADNIDDAKRLQPYVTEAEMLYLLPTIGGELFNEIASDTSKYVELLDGGVYDSNKKRFAGLTSAIAYLTYSRFIRNQGINVTSFGVVLKRGELSEPVNETTITRIANEAKNIGFEYLNQCVEYLKYKGMLNCNAKKTNKRKFKSIG